ncbi:anti-lipopolysaccharide factor-like [Portunus trituberculatus]|uniref:Anti-lipopolysaccharide factor n=1 Tax=Portunus trituberculatus TaxID=210409 RepID=A0A5B7IDJ9_PORTR|nr:anti-lipopolysaccharide factor-like [Portunus trituberculatus]MPC80343.1 Anti-lipopolysaccharide factor [Portunus trituberculatus]
MRPSVALSVVVVAVVATVMIPQCHAQEWESLLASIGEKIIGLWRNEKTEFMGRNCQLTVKPKILNFELYHEGRMWCPGWTPIVGEALTRSFSGVAGKTVQDFVKQAHDKGLITEEDAKVWLEV